MKKIKDYRLGRHLCSAKDWDDTMAEMVGCSSRGDPEGTAWVLAQCTPIDGEGDEVDRMFIDEIFTDPVLKGDHAELWWHLKQLCSPGLPLEFYQDYAGWLQSRGWAIDVPTTL
jgi:hypothetical protein